MKAATLNKVRTKLDIRFIATDSDNPFLLTETFNKNNAERVKEDLQAKLAHVTGDISRTHGYINVYTLGDAVIGKPQFVNFSKDVWAKILFPEPAIAIHQKSRSQEDDYLDHENYNDI